MKPVHTRSVFTSPAPPTGCVPSNQFLKRVANTVPAGQPCRVVVVNGNSVFVPHRWMLIGRWGDGDVEFEILWCERCGAEREREVKNFNED